MADSLAFLIFNDIRCRGIDNSLWIARMCGPLIRLRIGQGDFTALSLDQYLRATVVFERTITDYSVTGC